MPPLSFSATLKATFFHPLNNIIARMRASARPVNYEKETRFISRTECYTLILFGRVYWRNFVPFGRPGIRAFIAFTLFPSSRKIMYAKKTDKQTDRQTDRIG